MSVSSTPSTLSTVDEIILAAYKKSGLVPIEFSIGADVQWNAKAAHGRSVMNRLINELAVEGFLPYFENLEVVTLTAGDGTYTLDSDILNLVDEASYIPASNGSEVEETSGETPVKPISAHRWNQLSAKDATSRPVHYFLERNGASLNIHLWPVPDEAGKIRFRAHRIPGSNSLGTDNPDVKRHWDSWLVHALAYELMTDAKLPLDERAICRKDRDDKLAKIKSYETSNLAPDVIFIHSTPWSGWGG